MNGYSADLAQVCGCQWAATGNSAEEVVAKTRAHAKEAHQMNEVSAEIAQKLKAVIRPTM